MFKRGYRLIEIPQGRREEPIVLIFTGKRDQLVAISELSLQCKDGTYHPLQFRTLTAECLCMLGLVPDVGLGQLRLDFCQTILLVIEVKDTP